MPFPALTSIASPRLTIRPVGEADLPDLLAINGDPEVTRFLPYPTWQALADGAAWLTRMQALAAGGTGQQLVIARNADARVVGTLLLFKYDEGSARVELGYVLGRAFWRQGFMHEAITAICDHAFSAMKIRRIEAEVNPANVASNRVLLAVGFTLEGRLRQRWVAKGEAYDTNMYGCLAEEWLAARRALEARAVRSGAPGRLT